MTLGSTFFAGIDRGTFTNYWLDKTTHVCLSFTLQESSHRIGVGWPNLNPPLTTTIATGRAADFTVLVISVEIWTPYIFKKVPFIIPTSLLLADKYGWARALLHCRVICFVMFKVSSNKQSSW